nr:MAG TPA: hypothetical protein [Caudoviricetes sp.]
MDWKRETILHEVEHCMYKQMEKIMDEDELDSQDLDDIKDCLENICMIKDLQQKMAAEVKK